MGQLLTPDTFEFFARYLLAGFIFLSARSRFITGERPNTGETLIEAVILSLINQAVFLYGFGWLPADLLSRSHGQAGLFLELLLAGCLGAISGWLLSRNWVPDGFRRLILPITRPVPDAFEQAFSIVNSPCFVLVAYMDGREVTGFFGEQSYTGTEVKDGGIFLESLYSIGETGEWIEVNPRRSAWVSLNDVRSIEFFGTEDTENG